MDKKSKIIIALGANQTFEGRGPLDTLVETIRKVQNELLTVTRQSRWYSSPAFPTGSGPDYVNGAVAAETTMDPVQLQAHLHEIEAQMGRRRLVRWGPRACDLDQISYDDLVLPDADVYGQWRNLPLEAQKEQAPKQLILPHPRLEDRAFVLIPMRDVAPDWVHPVTGAGLDELIAALPQDSLLDLQVLDV